MLKLELFSDCKKIVAGVDEFYSLENTSQLSKNPAFYVFIMKCRIFLFETIFSIIYVG
jgi:hypothetical protein